MNNIIEEWKKKNLKRINYKKREKYNNYKKRRENKCNYRTIKSNSFIKLLKIIKLNSSNIWIYVIYI